MKNLIYTPKENSFLAKNISWLGSLLLLPIMLYFYFNIGNFLLIDYLNLLIHEGGHGIFRAFGDFIYTLGGTLMQIIIPTMFVVYYFIKKRKLGAQIFLVWLGQNFFNISVYTSDARAQKLPLLGGNKVYHDWAYMLNKLEIIEYDKLIGEIFIYLGLAAFCIALLVPMIIKKEKRINIDLNL
ncbi:MAG: hypothetical protein FD143_2111 [Ignavibacteria bacterium]|nr:MAG: hypothetical protein FD143_2111 [Ignavibacteria bacterium]KAF0159092.1 MAG: hypothetical protein FD188_2328 [Ignavibacteria bacterium]